VLSGGGARGAAHIGILKELERLRVPVDYIAGTSMGAIIGGLYASGMSTEEIERALVEIDWDSIFSDRAPREKLSTNRKFDDAFFLINKGVGFKDGKLQTGRGLIQGRKMYLKLKDLTLPVSSVTDFDQLSVPFRAVASDIATGQAVVLDSGDLASAIRASMSIPGFFAPVEIDGRLLVDGGVTNNLPVDVVRQMGADMAIVVDISTPLMDKEALGSVFSIVLQLTGIMTRGNTEEQLATLSENDVLIVPDLGSITTGDFTKAAEGVEMGIAAAQANEAALQGLAVSEAEYARHIAARASRGRGVPVIEFVHIDNDSSVADEVIRSRLRVEIGKPLDIPELEEDLATIYGLDVFENVSYRMVKDDGRSGLEIFVRERPWSPNYLQFGLSFSGDFSDNNRLALRFGYLRVPINRLNGELQFVVELGDEPSFVADLYQPLAVGSAYFVRPRLSYTRRLFNTFEDDQLIAQNRVRELGGSLAVGRDFGTWGQFEVGVSRSVGEVDLRVGVETVPEGDVDNGNFFARLRFDTLDDVNFPRSGVLGSLGVLSSSTSLGADTDFDQATLDVYGAKSWGNDTFLAGARYLKTYDGEAPIQSRFRLGGLFDLPGFVDDSLSGQHVILLRAGYMRALGRVASIPAYLGGTLQQGNVFEDEGDIDIDDTFTAGSIFFGLNTFLGPFYAGYGVAEGGNDSIYLLLGTQFR
jgi:NTE family protein